jgi:hypothetical protein
MPPPNPGASQVSTTGIDRDSVQREGRLDSPRKFLARHNAGYQKISQRSQTFADPKSLTDAVLS